MTLEDLLSMRRSELSRLLRAGHAIDPGALDDTEYDGVSLGQPRFVERLTWTKFKKVFHRDPASGELRGWNCKVEQTPVDEPWKLVHNADGPVTYWPYSVRLATHYAPAYPPGLVIDYGAVPRPALSMRWIRDPLVALEAGSVELLLGVSWLDVGFLRLGTPTWFALRRGVPLSHAVPA